MSKIVKDYLKKKKMKETAKFLLTDQKIFEKVKLIKESLLNDPAVPKEKIEKISFLIALTMMPCREIPNPSIEDVIYRLKTWPKEEDDPVTYQILQKLAQRLMSYFGITIESQ